MPDHVFDTTFNHAILFHAHYSFSDGYTRTDSPAHITGSLIFQSDIVSPLWLVGLLESSVSFLRLSLLCLLSLENNV